jgi:hypothetical protein
VSRRSARKDAAVQEDPLTDHAPDRLTQEEAEARAASVADVEYALDLDLEAGAKTFRGDLTITFGHRGGDTFLEWVGGSILRFEVNGTEMDPERDGARIALPAGILSERNEVRVGYEREYDHTGEGFHQFVDPEDGSEYLYTQFEPYSAHRLLSRASINPTSRRPTRSRSPPRRRGWSRPRAARSTGTSSPTGVPAVCSRRPCPSPPTCSRWSPGTTSLCTTSMPVSPSGCMPGRH